MDLVQIIRKLPWLRCKRNQEALYYLHVTLIGGHEDGSCGLPCLIMPLRKESLKVSKILVLSRSGILPTVENPCPLIHSQRIVSVNRRHPLPDLTKTGQLAPRLGGGPPRSSADTRRRRCPALPLCF